MATIDVTVADALAFDALPDETKAIARAVVREEVEDEITGEFNQDIASARDDEREVYRNEIAEKWAALREELTKRLDALEREAVEIRDMLAEFEP